MKKMLSILLVMMLALTPVFSMAETANAMKLTIPESNLYAFVQDFAGEPSDNLKAVDDILKTLGFAGYMTEAQGGLQLYLNDNTAVDLNVLPVVAEDGDTLFYVTSNLLGDKTVMLSLSALQEMAQQYGVTDQIATATESLNITDVVSKLDIEGIISLCQIESAEVALEATDDHDAATKVTTITIPKENLPKILELVAAAVPNMETEGVDSVASDIVVSIYNDAAGDLVYVEAGYSVTNEGTEVPVTMTYCKKTDDATVAHTVAVAADTGSATIYVIGVFVTNDAGDLDFSAVVKYAVGENETDLFALAGTVTSNEDAITVEVVVDGMVMPAPLYFIAALTDNGFAMELYNADSETQYLGLKLEPATCETTAIDTTAAVDVLKLSNEEMNTFMQEVQISAISALKGLISYLPASVLSLLMGA